MLVVAETRFGERMLPTDFDGADPDTRAEEMERAEKIVAALEKSGYIKFPS